MRRWLRRRTKPTAETRKRRATAGAQADLDRAAKEKAQAEAEKAAYDLSYWPNSARSYRPATQCAAWL